MKWFLLFLVFIEMPVLCLFYKFFMGVEAYVWLRIPKNT
jgi:hypothetical protein